MFLDLVFCCYFWYRVLNSKILEILNYYKLMGKLIIIYNINNIIVKKKKKIGRINDLMVNFLSFIIINEK